MDKLKKKKKPNREARQKKKAEEANVYEKGFLHGFDMGYKQAENEIRKAMIRQTINKNHEVLRGLRD